MLQMQPFIQLIRQHNKLMDNRATRHEEIDALSKGGGWQGKIVSQKIILTKMLSIRFIFGGGSECINLCFFVLWKTCAQCSTILGNIQMHEVRQALLRFKNIPLHFVCQLMAPTPIHQMRILGCPCELHEIVLQRFVSVFCNCAPHDICVALLQMT